MLKMLFLPTGSITTPSLPGAGLYSLLSAHKNTFGEA